MRAKAYVLIGIGGTWFLLVAWGLAARDVVLREAVLGILARLIAKIPPSLASVVFALLWCALLFGWCVPVIIGLRIFRRRQ